MYKYMRIVLALNDKSNISQFKSVTGMNPAQNPARSFAYAKKEASSL